MLVLSLRSLSVAVVFALTAGTALAGISGTITDSMSRPVAGATVRVIKGLSADTVSDIDGRFELAGQTEAAILLEHPNFEPTFVVSTGPPQHMEIRLASRQQARTIPPCRHTGKDSPLKALRLPIGRGFSERRSTDSDFELITVVNRSTMAQMRVWRQIISRGVPGPTWFSGVAAVSKTARLDLAGTQGFDVRAVTHKGQISRWFGWFYTIVEYTAVDSEDAAAFDRMIDATCYE